MKKYTVEIVVIILAIIVVGLFWHNEKNKPATPVPATGSQTQDQGTTQEQPEAQPQETAPTPDTTQPTQ